MHDIVWKIMHIFVLIYHDSVYIVHVHCMYTPMLIIGTASVLQ